MQVNKKFYVKRIGLFAFLVGFLLLFTAVSNVHAKVSTYSGYAYAIVDGNEVPLPGVRVIRVDTHTWPECPPETPNCWGVDRVMEAYTKDDEDPLIDGTFIMSDDGSSPYEPVPGCGDATGNRCQTTNYIGSRSWGGPCENLNYCGAACGMNPHWLLIKDKIGWKWTWLNDHYTVPWDDDAEGSYGGGRFNAVTEDTEFCGERYPDDWPDSYRGYRLISGNMDAYSMCDFEWLPPEEKEGVWCSLHVVPQLVNDTPAGIINVYATIHDPGQHVKCIVPGTESYGGELCGDRFWPVEVSGEVDRANGKYPICAGVEFHGDRADFITEGDATITYNEDDGHCDGNLMWWLQTRDYPTEWIPCRGSYAILDDGDIPNGDNSPPLVVSGPGAGVSGTETDDDNNPPAKFDDDCPDEVDGCKYLEDYDQDGVKGDGFNWPDQNPWYFSMTFRDPDGCEDIDEAYVWIDDKLPSHMEAHSSLHFGILNAGVGDSGQQWRVYGLECTEIGGCDNVGNWMWQVGGMLIDEVPPAGEPSAPYLYPSFKWAPDEPLPGDCTEVDVGSKCGGREGESKGGVYPIWAQCDGTDLTVKFRTWFIDNDGFNDGLGHDLDFYGYVVDSHDATDGWRDPAPGSWLLDFETPKASLEMEPDESGNIEYTATFSEKTPEDSGVMVMYEQSYGFENDSGNIVDVNPLAGIDKVGNMDEESVTRTHNPPLNIQNLPAGMDEVRGEVYVKDWGGNWGMAEVSHDLETLGGEDWIQTFGGDVYGWDGLDDPIFPDTGWLSKYWLGSFPSGSCGDNFGKGVGSAADPSPKGWCTAGYDDDNRKAVAGDWYLTLMKKVKNSDWVQLYGNTILSTPNRTLIKFNDRNDGVYEYTGGEVLEVVLNPGEKFEGRKIVFLKGSVAEIGPDFLVNGPGDGLILIGDLDSKIYVAIGSDSSSHEDRVDLAVITDGEYVVEGDGLHGDPPLVDRLLVSGFVFSDKASFLRELGSDYEKPTEQITYDARYLDLFRDMLASRKYDGFECGMVTGSDVCKGWYVP